MKTAKSKIWLGFWIILGLTFILGTLSTYIEIPINNFGLILVVTCIVYLIIALILSSLPAINNDKTNYKNKGGS